MPQNIFRNKMAVMFIRIKNKSNTIMAAAITDINPCSGLRSQLKACEAGPCLCGVPPLSEVKTTKVFSVNFNQSSRGNDAPTFWSTPSIVAA